VPVELSDVHSNGYSPKREYVADNEPAGKSDPAAVNKPASDGHAISSEPRDLLSPTPIAISVLVSDSTEMGCELLSTALTTPKIGFHIVGAAISSKPLLETAVAVKPEIALVSLGLREGPTAGLQALKELRAQAPATQCILLMDKPCQDIVTEALRAGAKGVFLRNSPVDMLLRCIRVVRDGQVWISNADLRRIIDVFSTWTPVRVQNATGQDVLSNREREIVSLVVQGLSNREIAQEAHLSEHTVKNYLLRIFDKLGVSSRAELIVRILSDQGTGT